MPQHRETSPTSPAAVELLTEYFTDRARTFPGGPDAYRTVFPSAEAFTPPRGVFLVSRPDAEAGDAGCGGIRRIDDSPAGAVRYEVKHLYVRPEARGTGLGGDILAELERRALDFGADELVLDTNASLESAGRLYARAGFVGVEPYNDNPNATNWYSKPLDPR